MDKNDAPRIGLHSLKSLFRDTWNLYRERWSVLVEIVLLPALVTVLGYVLVGLGLPFSIIGGIVIFVGWIVFMFSVLPIIYSIHNTAGVDASYEATLGWFWPFVWLTILEILAIMGGFFMIIVPGIWLAFALSFMSYVFVIEHRRGLDALRQSKDYIKGYWWAVAGRVILLGLFYMALAMIVDFPVALLAGRTAGSIVSMALALFFIPFSIIYHYLIFKNLRELKPELADARPEKGGGFIKASAIVGFVAPILIVILAIAFVAMGTFSILRHADHNVPPPGYGMQ